MPVNLGLIGLGWAGNKHLESLAQIDGANVAAIADLDVEKLAATCAAHEARGYGHWRDMLAAETELNAVVLAAPPSVRLVPIERIADRGLALFCEKPPAADLATARQAAAAIERAGILHTVGLQNRWLPAADRLRGILAGRPRLFQRLVVAWPVLDWVAAGGVPRTLLSKAASGGPIVEQGIHFQDVLRYVTGDDPVAVHGWADLGRVHEPAGRDSEETTVLTVRHTSGVLTTHVHNWSYRAGPLIELQVVGVDFDLTWRLKENDHLVGLVDGERIDERADEAPDPHLEEMRGFVAAVEAGDPTLLRCEFRDACRSLAVCEAAARAVQSGVAQPVEMLA